MDQPFPRFLISEADPLKRGRQLGEQAREYVRGSIAVYAETFAHYAGLGWADVRRHASNYFEPIATYDPAIAQELTGIALGAGVPVEDILAINARTEIMFGLSVLPPSECTSFFAGPKASLDGHVLIGQNWDWRARTRDTTILVELDQQPKPSLLMLAEAGLVGKIGFNSAGVGVAVNTLVSELDQGLPAVPFHVILRGILNSTSLEEARNAVTRAGRAASANYLIATNAGEAVDIETAPGRRSEAFETEVLDDLFAHANNFECSVPFVDASIGRWPDSPVRARTLRGLLEDQRASLDATVLTHLLRDHTCAPNAICRHADPSQHPVEQSSTVASWIADLTDGHALVCAGPPCSGTYHAVRPRFRVGQGSPNL
jgi:isopenicillin-N N-acyltransferase-like protein